MTLTFEKGSIPRRKPRGCARPTVWTTQKADGSKAIGFSRCKMYSLVKEFCRRWTVSHPPRASYFKRGPKTTWPRSRCCKDPQISAHNSVSDAYVFGEWATIDDEKITLPLNKTVPHHWPKVILLRYNDDKESLCCYVRCAVDERFWEEIMTYSRNTREEKYA